MGLVEVRGSRPLRSESGANYYPTHHVSNKPLNVFYSLKIHQLVYCDKKQNNHPGCLAYSCFNTWLVTARVTYTPVDAFGKRRLGDGFRHLDFHFAYLCMSASGGMDTHLEPHHLCFAESPSPFFWDQSHKYVYVRDPFFVSDLISC